jgi:hypothetical protein
VRGRRHTDPYLPCDCICTVYPDSNIEYRYVKECDLDE